MLLPGAIWKAPIGANKKSRKKERKKLDHLKRKKKKTQHAIGQPFKKRKKERKIKKGKML